jgi:hypothetical protein
MFCKIKEMEKDRDALKHHNPAWLTKLLEHRLYVAAFPGSREDALYYCDILRAGYIVNMTPLTTETTASGKNNKNEFYTAFWQHGERSEKIRMIREPLPADHASQSDSNRVKTLGKLFFIYYARKLTTD